MIKEIGIVDFRTLVDRLVEGRCNGVECDEDMSTLIVYLKASEVSLRRTGAGSCPTSDLPGDPVLNLGHTAWQRKMVIGERDVTSRAEHSRKRFFTA